MKILLVTRGSQGDVLPYLAIAAELERRGHEVTINLPQIFEETVKPYGFKYVLQQFDDIGGMIDSAAQNSHKFRPFLKWMRNVIDKQFDQLIPLLKEQLGICCRKYRRVLQEALDTYRLRPVLAG